MFSKKIAAAVGFLAIVSVSSPALAEDTYGSAGCGLGSVLFGGGTGMKQIFAATTNGSSGNQTFGITSGTSNCDKAPGAAATAKVFIEVNREALARDVSRGNGETIASLAAIAGCSNADAVGIKLKSQFEAIFPNAQVPSDSVSRAVVDVLRTDTQLACTGLST